MIEAISAEKRVAVLSSASGSVKELVDKEDWGAIACLLCSGKPMDIANYSILLPDDFKDYIEAESAIVAEGDIAKRSASLQVTKQKHKETQEAAEKWKQEELANIPEDPQIQKIA